MSDVEKTVPFPRLTVATTANPRPATPLERNRLAEITAHAETLREKLSHVDQDDLVQAIKGHKDPTSVLHIILEGMAREAAALSFARDEADKRGKDTSQLSLRRIDALKKVADLRMELQKQGTDILDIRSEKVQKLMGLWLESFREVATEVLSREQIDLLFSKLSAALQGWETKADAHLKGSLWLRLSRRKALA
jgi:hypothetical protein